ncbi:MAG: 2-hydroxychromene-2-carboxylate isomerase [Burkholderiaceae bacterium]|nr:2-hydroxychromene-2-carboxylate isomerase [Burkholderiaceae bacterium]
MNDTPQDTASIEIWFDFASHYSYLAVMRVEDVAAARGVAVRWKPVLLGPVFRAIGWQSSPFIDQKAKGEYAWRDIERQCRKYGLELVRPSVFPRASLTPLRVALAGADEPWIGDFCREVMRMNFARDLDIDSADAVGDALGRLGLPPGPILARALSDTNKLALRTQTEEARRRGLFGAPTFFAGDEMFWGNDRLEDALEHAAGPGRRTARETGE